MDRYDFGRRWRRVASVSRPLRRMWFEPSTCAVWPKACPQPQPTPFFRTTSENQTPSPRDERLAEHPPTELRGSPAGDRHRAAGVPNAVVAGDVRARAVEAVRHLPGRDPGRARGGLHGLLALRPRLARDERGGGRWPPPAGDRHRAACEAVRDRRPPR